jgi:hypothetical protein
MCVALGQKLSGFERALFFHDAMYEEMVLAAKQYDVPAPHVFHGGLPNHCDILRPHPRKHACALNAERDAAAALQGVRNSHAIARAALTAYSLRFFAPVGSRLHLFLKSERSPSGSKDLISSNERGVSTAIKHSLPGGGVAHKSPARLSNRVVALRRTKNSCEV